MISVREAEKILSKFHFNKTEYIKIEDAYGRVLAEDIICRKIKIYLGLKK